MAADDLKQNDPADPRVQFAAERTLLAWARTGLAMMGFGFVVARFGLFLREIAAVRQAPPVSHPGVSMWIGTALVVLGVVVTLCAAVKHWQTVRRLERGEVLRFSPLSLGTIVALLLALLGLLIAGYLLFGLSEAMGPAPQTTQTTAPFGISVASASRSGYCGGWQQHRDRWADPQRHHRGGLG
jgi:putative membrane protein